MFEIVRDKKVILTHIRQASGEIVIIAVALENQAPSERRSRRGRL
jgi:hypothetical protein